MNVVVLPYRTYHNIRGPISKYVDNAKIITLLNKDFIDISTDYWIDIIDKRLKRLAEKYRNGNIILILSFKAMISSIVFYKMTEFFDKFYIAAWDNRISQYIMYVYENKEVRRFYGERID